MATPAFFLFSTMERTLLSLRGSTVPVCFSCISITTFLEVSDCNKLCKITVFLCRAISNVTLLKVCVEEIYKITVSAKV